MRSEKHGSGQPAASAMPFSQWWSNGGHALVSKAADLRGWKGAAEQGYIGGLLSGGVAVSTFAEPRFWDHAYPDSNPDATCGDRPRDYRSAAPVAQEPVARVNDEGFIVETGIPLAPGTKLYTNSPAAAQAQPTAQDREDAERYAYLRDTPRSEWPESLRSAVDLQQNAILDREIDAARAAKGADHG